MDGSPGRDLGLIGVPGSVGAKQSGGHTRVVPLRLGFPARGGRQHGDAGLSLPSSGNSSLFQRAVGFTATHGGS